MKIDKLIKYCLQYLELDTETDVMKTSIDELAQNDTFVEYMNNIENSIYMGVTRYASSKKIPVKLYEIPVGTYSVDLVSTKSLPVRNSDGTFATETNGNTRYTDVTKPLANYVKEVFAFDENNNIVSNIEYYVIGNKVIIKKPKTNYRYNVIYHPTINEFTFYLKNEVDDIYSIELNDLGITDEMAINLKYFVYSDLKIEENPNLASSNKNVFEAYLESLQNNQVSFNQTEMYDRTNIDYESDSNNSRYNEWRDIFGD